MTKPLLEAAASFDDATQPIPTRLALFLLEIKMAHKQLGDMIDQLEDEVKKEASK